jgi:hypothetical protein
MTRDRLLAMLNKLGPGVEADNVLSVAPSPPWTVCSLCGSKYHMPDCELDAVVEWLEDEKNCVGIPPENPGRGGQSTATWPQGWVLR